MSNVLHVNPANWERGVNAKINRELKQGGSMNTRNPRGVPITTAQVAKAKKMRHQKKPKSWTKIAKILKLNQGALIRAVKKSTGGLPKVKRAGKPAKKRVLGRTYKQTVKKFGVTEGAKIWKKGKVSKSLKKKVTPKKAAGKVAKPRKIPGKVAGKPGKVSTTRITKTGISSRDVSKIAAVIGRDMNKAMKTALSGRKIELSGRIRNPRNRSYLSGYGGVGPYGKPYKKPPKKRGPKRNAVRNARRKGFLGKNAPQNIAIMAGSAVVSRLIGNAFERGLYKVTGARTDQFSAFVSNNAHLVGQGLATVVGYTPYWLKKGKRVKRIPFINNVTDKVAYGSAINFAVALGQKVVQRLRGTPALGSVGGHSPLSTIFIPSAPAINVTAQNTEVLPSSPMDKTPFGSDDFDAGIEGWD